MRLLINAHADVNAAVSANGWTPLMYAATAKQNGSSIIEMLIAEGARIGSKSSDGVTARRVALMFGNSDSAQLLQKYENAEAKRLAKKQSQAPVTQAAASGGGARQKSSPDYKYILAVLDKVPSYVCDINQDGQVNCIDYAITYKELWDETVPRDLQDCCEIVRNYDREDADGMNHLFVRVRESTTQDWLFLEPQGDRSCYNIVDIWNDRYKPKYNIYGETNWWLARSKKR